MSPFPSFFLSLNKRKSAGTLAFGDPCLSRPGMSRDTRSGGVPRILLCLCASFFPDWCPAPLQFFPRIFRGLFIKTRFLQKSEGHFFEQTIEDWSWVNFAGDFWLIFSGLFLEKRWKKAHPPKNPWQNSNQNLGVSRAKFTCKNQALII